MPTETLYKLTDGAGYTRNGTQWVAGYTNRVRMPVSNPRLCTCDVLHAYRDLDFGLLMNPKHANLLTLRVFEVEGEVVVDDWDKVGCFEIKVLRELPIPEWYSDPDLRLRVYRLSSIRFYETVLPLFEQAHPDDDRLRKTVAAAYADYVANAAAYAAYVADAAADAAAYAAYVANATAGGLDCVSILQDVIAEVLQNG